METYLLRYMGIVNRERFSKNGFQERAVLLGGMGVINQSSVLVFLFFLEMLDGKPGKYLSTRFPPKKRLNPAYGCLLDPAWFLLNSLVGLYLSAPW